MTISTTNYQMAHGSKPKGWGCWKFNISGHATLADTTLTFCATYTVAKQNAVRLASDWNYTRVEVAE